MEYLPVTNAQKSILDTVPTLGVETVKLEDSLARVLAEDVHANRDLPPYDVSAMDGYAVRSEDLVRVPAHLAIIEDIKAGDMPSKAVKAGQCARIMTGAPVPQGADAVIRVEDTLALPENKAQINRAVKPGNDIRLRGEGMRNGEVVLRVGTEITPGVTGVLATVKCAQVRVYRRPRVAILSTGNELEGMDDPVDPDKIPNSNSYALMAQVQALGIEPDLLGIARDDPAELEEYLQRGLRFDVLLVSGGSSVGVHDYVRPILETLGVRMKFWRVAMKPGHPVAFGVLQRNHDVTSKAVEADEVQGARRAATQAYLENRQGSEHRATQQCAGSTAFVFGLPGNPVSSMVCFEEFVAPALRRMMGHARLFRRTIAARLTHDIKHQPGRTEFVRVTLAKDERGYAATSTGAQGSGMLLSMARADGLMVVPAESTGLVAGEQVTVQLLDGTVFQDDAGFKE
ncbi:MAG TPA: molybdopterin molybdotransferase MoeA [Gallionella sp.]|nr:molybdopterin molybdotransferase MoeA [Gallionella sp.]